MIVAVFTAEVVLKLAAYGCGGTHGPIVDRLFDDGC